QLHVILEGLRIGRCFPALQQNEIAWREHSFEHVPGDETRGLAIESEKIGALLRALGFLPLLWPGRVDQRERRSSDLSFVEPLFGQLAPFGCTRIARDLADAQVIVGEDSLAAFLLHGMVPGTR